MELDPTALIFALHSGPKDSEHVFATYKGEIRVDIDSDETAFITPCHRVEMTEEVQALLIDRLEPLGIKYMRWWRDGHLIGRTFNMEVL